MKKLTFFALMAACLFAGAKSGRAQAFVGLGSTGNTISTYAAPGAVPTRYAVTGLAGDTIVNIDYFSSSTGQLFGIGGSGTLYTLAQATPTTYAATVNVANAVPGATIVDFNPSANRLRVYAGTSNNRLTPGSGLVTNDGELNYASGDVNFGAVPALAGAAYTNNFSGAATTALYSLDSDLDALILNTGTPAFSTLTTVGTLLSGGVRLDIGLDTTGFDILTVGGVNTAYLSSGNRLFTVNLTTGALTSVGTQRGTTLVDIAFAPVPEPGTYAMMAIGGLAVVVFGGRRRQRMAA